MDFQQFLGAKIGCPDTPVIGFAGDGAFGISMNEMSSCASEKNGQLFQWLF